MIAKTGIQLAQKIGGNSYKVPTKKVSEISQRLLSEYGLIGRRDTKKYFNDLFTPKSGYRVITTPKGYKQLWKKSGTKDKLLYSFKDNGDGTAILKVHVNTTESKSDIKQIGTHFLKEQENGEYLYTDLKHWRYQKSPNQTMITNITKDADSAKGTHTFFSVV